MYYEDFFVCSECKHINDTVKMSFFYRLPPKILHTLTPTIHYTHTRPLLSMTVFDELTKYIININKYSTFIFETSAKQLRPPTMTVPSTVPKPPNFTGRGKGKVGRLGTVDG